MYRLLVQEADTDDLTDGDSVLLAPRVYGLFGNPDGRDEIITAGDVFLVGRFGP